MRNIFFVILLLSIVTSNLQAQDTFSIVAVDSVTGEIGSAGASCIDEGAIAGGAIIISDILPGRGAIHTQSYWLAANQQNARLRMEEGLSPEDIIDWLEENDAQNNPGRRQYGIVDFDSTGSPRSAAFTGETCMDWKGHISGGYYAIQGNILLGEEIIDSIESRFLNTEGMLAERLMAALQGANVIGADSRCTAEGVSSLSAFIRVAQTADTTGEFYLDLNVPSTPYGVEPIDSLQVLFDAWLNLLNTNEKFLNHPGIRIYPNPASAEVIIEIPDLILNDKIRVQFTDNSGRSVFNKELNSLKNQLNIDHLSPGFYLVAVRNNGKLIYREKLLINN